MNVCIEYDATVSGVHCKIFMRNGKYYISDLNSSNGTIVNGERVLDSAEIFTGTIIELGKTKLQVTLL